ncbi:MAG: zincin-like metallopeptidase domain-containing protein [Gammaproteobacteria bacterium]|nr:zincin-like metallopeptidase domain-containing protein [Gammaproteobacteria bacterium]
MKRFESIDKRVSSEEIWKFLLDELAKPIPTWKPGNERKFVRSYPHNAVTDRSYRGWINLMLLCWSMRQLDTVDGGFLTEKQANRLGVKVKKDETPCPIAYANFQTGVYKNYFVYHISQTIGFERPASGLHTWDPNSRVEDLLEKSHARIIHEQELSDPHYDFYRDTIYVPLRERFFDSSMYYQAMLHELAHWTGHDSRLNRDFFSQFWNEETRAREELRAEIASWLLGMEFGIGHDPIRNMAYLEYWKNYLLFGYEEMRLAVEDALKICNYIRKIDEQAGRMSERRFNGSAVQRQS